MTINYLRLYKSYSFIRESQKELIRRYHLDKKMKCPIHFCLGQEGFPALLSDFLVGICVLHVVLDEAQINFFVVNQKYRKKGFGTQLMSYLIKHCEEFNINKLYLEVSHNNSIAEKFYSSFDFSTVGIRRNYYKDGSDALLKEKKLINK